MLKQFATQIATWFIFFGLSILVSDVFGWTEQGKAFFYISLGASIIDNFAPVVHFVRAGRAERYAALVNRIFFFSVLTKVAALAFLLFAIWVVTKLFGVDYYVAYQIMVFGQCFYTETEKLEE